MSEIKLGQEAERGPPGPTGPPGPQGATGDLSSLQKGLTALAKFHVLSKHFEEFKKLAEKFETAANDELANMRQQRHVPVGRWGQQSTGQTTGQLETRILDLLRADFGSEVIVNLHNHPRFDANHFIPVPYLDEIEDDFSKEEFRKLTDQYKSAKETIIGLSNTYTAAISKAEQEIVELSRSIPK